MFLSSARERGNEACLKAGAAASSMSDTIKDQAEKSSVNAVDLKEEQDNRAR